MDPNVRIKEIDKKIRLIGLMDTPGCIMIGFGLHSKFVAKGNAFHPMLNNDFIVNGMLVVGGAIMLLCFYKVYGLSLEKSRLHKGG